MAAFLSSPQALCLHGVRLLGAADESRVAARFHLERAAVRELLLDFESVGWVARREFAGLHAWSLTEAGRMENERQLSAELDECGERDVVVEAHAAFAPLNGVLLRAVTDWQLRPLPGEPLAPNDHTDFRWDDRVLERLASVGRQLAPITEALSSALARFEGYASRYSTALRRAEAGEARWVDAIEVDSCHLVWMQLHEDLIATLGLSRNPSA